MSLSIEVLKESMKRTIIREAFISILFLTIVVIHEISPKKIGYPFRANPYSFIILLFSIAVIGMIYGQAYMIRVIERQTGSEIRL